jgi:hypothetical protein
MEERGFDALQKGNGPALLILSTVLLTLFILAGGLFLRYKEMEWRRKNAEEQSNRSDDSASHPAG